MTVAANDVSRRPSHLPHRALLIIGIVLGLAIVVGCVLLFPKLLVTADIGTRAFDDMNPNLRAKAISDVRNSLLQGLGGAVLLLGAFFTWRQLQVTREGQITDRFIKAIEQLAHKEVDAQVGAIYALARIANDSKEDREAIVDVLTAYVRQHSPKPKDTENHALGPSLRMRYPNVQAAVTILGNRIPPLNDSWKLVLYNTDLRGASFRDANLKSAYFDGASLQKAHFDRADLSQARLQGAYLDGAHFHDANLLKADLRYARLRGAHLKGAKNLETANLNKARCDGRTRWPSGFDWGSAGVIMNDGQQPDANRAEK